MLTKCLSLSKQINDWFIDLISLRYCSRPAVYSLFIDVVVDVEDQHYETTPTTKRCELTTQRIMQEFHPRQRIRRSLNESIRNFDETDIEHLKETLTPVVLRADMARTETTSSDIIPSRTTVVNHCIKCRQTSRTKFWLERYIDVRACCFLLCEYVADN